jgi:hypothetical protein
VNSGAQRVMFVARRVDFSSGSDVQGIESDICSSVIDPIQEVVLTSHLTIVYFRLTGKLLLQNQTT